MKNLLECERSMNTNVFVSKDRYRVSEMLSAQLSCFESEHFFPFEP